MVFCTLFDSFYLDKGIVLYRSLEKCSGTSFTLYVFCFDDTSYEILESMHLDRAILIRSTVLESETMLRLKAERTKAEYCWTCTPQIIEYVLNNYDENNVTYIDADLYFFQNPQPLLEEIVEADANIVITEHRFADTKRGRRLLRRSGKYCVEFNYFDKSENASKCLGWWKDKCIEWCYHIYEPERMGDQKYLEKFPTLFEGVHELQHLGGGVAPWNLDQYMLDKNTSDTDKRIRLKARSNAKAVNFSTEPFDLIFYHFQNIRYIGKNHVNVYSGTRDKALKDKIYLPYLREIEMAREELEKKGIRFSVKKSYSSNKLIAFFQATLLRYKIRSLSDIYDLSLLRGIDD